jgi:SAM-dependent MidA family methyltransferase
MVTLGTDGRLQLTTEHAFTENVEKVLRPDKLFGKDVAKEVKVGDSIEVCPAAASLTQEIMQLLEVSRGTALIIDYGEDHAFSNSFRVR